MQPLDTRIVVIVQECRRGEMVNGVPAFGDAAREIPKVHHLFQRRISGSDLGLVATSSRCTSKARACRVEASSISGL